MQLQLNKIIKILRFEFNFNKNKHITQYRKGRTRNKYLSAIAHCYFRLFDGDSVFSWNSSKIMLHWKSKYSNTWAKITESISTSRYSIKEKGGR